MGGLSDGIGRIERETNGDLSWHGIVAGIESPSFLSRFGDTIYAVGEGGPSVSAFRVSNSELHFLGTQTAAGEYPCSLAVLGAGAFVAVASYGNGAIGVHR